MKKFLLEIIVFICGALVMIYEITGSRLLAPYIGTSTYIWTSLIGVILGALSLGYWLGGKLADEKPDAKILAAAIFLGGALVSLTIFLKDIVLTVVAGADFGLEIKSVLAALLLFAPASVFLGFVTPYAVRLKINSVENTGKTVGSLYAFSTVGSIFGTFLAGFFLIPFIGSTRTLYLIAGSLFFLAIGLFPFAVSKWKIAAIILFFAGIGFNELYGFYLKKSQNFHDFDTEYSRVQIFDTIDSENGRPKRVLKIDPFYNQSSIYLDTGENASGYIKFYHLIEDFNPKFEKILMIGGAGFSFPKEFLEKYPEAEIDVVEIDPAMTRLAEKFFRLEQNPRLKIFHEDGRIFLNRAPGEKYDAVLIDAFTTLFSMPFHLTTLEAAREIKRVLKKPGVVITNIGGALEGEKSGFLRAELATYRKIFAETHLLKIDPKPENERIQNWIVIAFDRKNFPNENFFENELLRKTRTEIPELSNAPVLRDDLAPVEYFNSYAR